MANYKKMPISCDLTLYKGQTYSQNVRFISKTTGDPIQLDGITAKAQVRPSLNSEKLTADLHATVFADEGKISLSQDSAETAQIDPGFYVWDMRMTDADGDVKYCLRGHFLVTGRVTK